MRRLLAVWMVLGLVSGSCASGSTTSEDLSAERDALLVERDALGREARQAAQDLVAAEAELTRLRSLLGDARADRDSLQALLDDVFAEREAEREAVRRQLESTTDTDQRGMDGDGTEIGAAHAEMETRAVLAESMRAFYSEIVMTEVVQALPVPADPPIENRCAPPAPLPDSGDFAPWIVSLHLAATEVSEQVNRLHDALAATDDYSPGWATREPVRSALLRVIAAERLANAAIDEAWASGALDEGYPLEEMPRGYFEMRVLPDDLLTQNSRSGAVDIWVWGPCGWGSTLAELTDAVVGHTENQG